MSNGKGMTPKKCYNQKNWNSNYDLIDWGRKPNQYKCSKCDNDDWQPIPCSLAEACRNCGAVRVLGDDGSYSSGPNIKEWLNDISEQTQTHYMKDYPCDWIGD